MRQAFQPSDLLGISLHTFRLAKANFGNGSEQSIFTFDVMIGAVRETNCSTNG